MMTLRATFETKVFLCEAGYITIKQISHLGDDDHLILLSPDQAEQIAIELQRLVDEKHEWWSIEEEDEEEDEQPPLKAAATSSPLDAHGN